MTSQSQVLALPETTYGRVSKWVIPDLGQIEKSRKSSKSIEHQQQEERRALGEAGNQ